MDIYPWVVLVHVAAVVLTFFAHGASATAALRLRYERDPARIGALLDASAWSLGVAGIGLLVLLLSGITAGIMGGWWGRGWIWLSLALVIVISGLMTPLGSNYLSEVRRAIGQPTRDPKRDAAARPLSPEELDLLLRSPKPGQAAAIGLGGLLVILWLMMLKPF